jgi:hypothetical protein
MSKAETKVFTSLTKGFEKMLAFVDEAGDVGFKFSKGSSRFFIVTIVLFEEREGAKRCDSHIDLIFLPVCLRFGIRECESIFERSRRRY